MGIRKVSNMGNCSPKRKKKTDEISFWLHYLFLFLKRSWGPDRSQLTSFTGSRLLIFYIKKLALKHDFFLGSWRKWHLIHRLSTARIYIYSPNLHYLLAHVIPWKRCEGSARESEKSDIVLSNFHFYFFRWHTYFK